MQSFNDQANPPPRFPLIIDNFAGGGGASTGIEMALGRSPNFAINHDPEALCMHESNHPETVHLCESVWDVDIAETVAGPRRASAAFTRASSSLGPPSLVALSFLNAGFGGLVLTVKSDETEHWTEYARQTGRAKDLIIFNAGRLSFDPLAYTWNIPGRSAAHIETIVELFTTLMAVGKVYQPSSGERYFEQAVEELMRAVLIVLSNAGEPISITAIHKVVCSPPVEREQVDAQAWQESSECSRVISKLRERRTNFTPTQWDDLDIAIVYLLEKWPSLDPRTRSNVESTWSGMASKFTYSPFREMFCSGRVDFTPEQTTHERKIVIVDMPILEYGRETARLCQVLVKIIFQRAWLRHQYKLGCCHGAFLFQDEFALLMHRHEAQFHMVCRSSGIAPICITPNILNIAAEEFGEQTPGSKTLGFLGLLSVKIFNANNETQTNEYAANQIGREYRYRTESTSASNDKVN